MREKWLICDETGEPVLTKQGHGYVDHPDEIAMKARLQAEFAGEVVEARVHPPSEGALCRFEIHRETEVAPVAPLPPKAPPKKRPPSAQPSLL